MTTSIKKIKTRASSLLRGFTLIETLLAVLILATAIAGPLTIASKGLSTALVAKDETTAYYLAQDAVEFVRYARDTNKLKGYDWLAGNASFPRTVLTPCESSSGCYLDSLYNSPATPTACSGSCPLLSYDASGDYYNYAGSAPTIFRRTILITTPVGTAPNSNSDEASLTVSVSWSDLPGITHSVTVREELFNWQ